jgi:putative cell wall binding repeat-containing domain protein (fragment)
MFEGCSSLEKITFPDKVTTIEASAFLDCTALKEIVWSKALTAIEGSAFKNCSSLTEIAVPETVTSLGNQAFSNCDALTTITIPDSVTSFGTSMFYDCDALVTVNLGSGLTAIPKSSFEHCDVLESVTVPRRVTSIAADAFKNSVKFTSIFIPRSVTSIDSTAFSYPAKLTIYGVPGTYAETFANENSITFVAQQTGATAVALDQTTLSLAKGSSAQLKLTVTPENFTDAVTWKSADTSVATVSDTGLVKAVNNGSTVIKVTVGSVSASCKVTVVQPVTGISLNRTSLTLEALGTFQLTVRITPANAEDPRVRWSSSAPEIAAVSDTGLVTALKKGTAVITVTSMDGSNISRTCTVTVSNTAYICKTADELESPHNYENSCTDVWSYTLPGATELNVTFDTRTCMEDGFDFLYLYDANGTEIGKYTGTELAGKTITIPGDTVRIKMASDDSGNEWGFKAQVRADAGELANGVKWSFRPSENTLSINGAILEGHKVLIACYDDNGKLTKLEVWTVSGSVKLPDSARICVFYIDEANKPLCAAATVRG